MAKVTTANAGDVALLPYPAQTPMVEQLDWLTDVFESHDGTEETLGLRSAPRTLLTYRWPEQPDEAAEGLNTLRGALRRKWAVPLWHEAQYVGTIAGGATSVSCTTAGYDFRDDGLALLFRHKTAYQLVDVTTVGGSSISLAAPATAITGAYLVPVRTGYILGEPVRRQKYGAQVEAVFELEDNRAVSAATPTQFLSEDLYTSEVLHPGAVEEVRLLAPSDRADYSLGPVQRRAPWLYNRQSSTHQYVLEGHAAVYEFRQFLARRVGKYRAFWQPSFNNDLRKVGAGTITTTFRFRKDSFLEWAADRLHVAFQDDSGVWYPRTLSGVSSFNSSTLTSTLNTGLGLDYSQIRCVSFLGRRRLTADSAELNFIGNGVVECTLGVTELSP